MVGETIEKRGGHLRVAEDSGPLSEGEVGGDDNRGLLVEPADQVKEQLAAGLGERQVAEFVERDGREVGRVGRTRRGRSGIVEETAPELRSFATASPGASW